MSENGDDFRPVTNDRRLDQLDERLAQAAAVEAERTGQGSASTADPNARMANRVLSDLIGGIAGGALIGWLVDRVAGTTPWGLMIFLALGIIVAFRNIFRLAGAASKATPPADDGK